jgi:ubiquinone/menaquinone biosynthesis C-methylase UbiE
MGKRTWFNFAKEEKEIRLIMNHSLYKKSFELFLDCTNEKRVVYDFIKKNIHLDKNTDFLDIGGGEGCLANKISKKVKSTLVIEPNIEFCKRLSEFKLKFINSKWENVVLKKKYDFILAAYVFTHFSKAKRKKLIEKMYNYLNIGGQILILSIDAKKGSWREIHSYFYKLMGIKHQSSDDDLKEIIKKYHINSYSFKTNIIADNVDTILKMLSFDFCKYPKEFTKFTNKLSLFLEKYANKNGKIILEMAHNAYIIKKL